MNAPRDTRNRCRKCKAPLSIYNSTGECFKHSVFIDNDRVNEDAMKVCTSRPQPLLHEERGQYSKTD